SRWFDENIDEDLNDQLQNIHDHIFITTDRSTFRDYYEDVIQVYRGQTLSDLELDRLKNSIGQLISNNGFLSTTRSLDIASIFATNTILIINIKTQLEGVVFADVRSHSETPHEEEILFDLATIFKILEVEYDDSNKSI
ncbi:unnamed protein product, partial [Adineta steineri]